MEERCPLKQGNRSVSIHGDITVEQGPIRELAEIPGAISRNARKGRRGRSLGRCAYAEDEIVLQ